MRTQFLYVGLLSMTLAGGLVSAGCSDIHTGQPGDPGGPVKLVRAMVQDDDIAGQGGIGSAIDLLDRVGTPLSVAYECDPDRKPCNVQYLVNGGGTFSCEEDTASTGWTPSATGFRCTDPLNPQNPDGSAVPIPLQPSTGGPGAISGTEIRLVFSKVLNSSEIEEISTDPNLPPGDQLSYSVKSGIVELLGPDGAPVPITVVWDPAGSSTQTSDVIGNPFGSALIIKIGQLVDAMGNPDPAGTTNYDLQEASKYTIVLHSDKIHDRKGNPLADQNGTVLTSDYTIDFTTDVTAPVGGAPDVAALPTDGVIQLSYLHGVEEISATITNADETPAAFKVLAYTDRADDPAKCAANEDPTTVDITAVDDAGAPIAWPAGKYSITVTAKHTNSYGAASTGEASFAVKVDPAAKSVAATSQAAHVTPAQCTS
jgi:hypothetical protein